MKLATLKDGSRDGTLAVVSRDLSRMAPVSSVARNMQIAIEKWPEAAPRLREFYAAVNAGTADGIRDYDPEALEAPLPRSYQFIDGGAYLIHVERVRKARGNDLPEHFRETPLMYQAASDGFLRPTGDISVADSAWGVDMAAQLGVIVDDVPAGISAENAAAHIQLLVIINDISYRYMLRDDAAKGVGFLHSKPRSALSPVALTPDELGAAWDGSRLHLDMLVKLNGAPIGMPNCGTDMDFSFPQLIAHAAKTRPLAAGTLIGSGTVSNVEPGTGVSSLVELRAVQFIVEGREKTSYMQYGDRVQIEAVDADGVPVFGTIDQEVVPY